MSNHIVHTYNYIMTYNRFRNLFRNFFQLDWNGYKRQLLVTLELISFNDQTIFIVIAHFFFDLLDVLVFRI